MALGRIRSGGFADLPKLTPAEAKSLIAWEDLGQKDGVKTHALTFYESQADKDAKRGRMIVAKVSKGDRSATAWMVDGEDKTFGALAQAKKLAEEVGMAKAVADGFVEATAAKPAVTAKPASAAATGAAITDFGQKIGGARKDVWSGFKDDLNKVGDDDIAGQPLAKVWPAPDYQKLIDAGMDAKSVAAVRALRDEVPAKPRAAWKVKRWAEQVKTLRGLANDVMDGKITVQDMERMGANKGTSLRGMMGRIELYELVGHGKSLEGVRFAEHHYTLYRGRENVNLWVVEKDAGASAFSNWPQEIAIGDTKEQALAAFREKYDSLDLQNAVRKAAFDIFSERGSNAFYVGKKIGRNYAKLEGPFNTVREAREYREKNLAALEAKLEKYKEIPRERSDVNQPRVGVDMRNGQDVTPQMFGEVFGFRGVEFGNWVEQKRRQKDLNDAFDALMDMAAVLDIPPKAISLNGQLGLAFGARGSGGVHPAAAHYEPDNVVINLTKKEGAGSLGHEWWHALDNYFAKQRKVNRGSFMTTGTDVGLAARGKDYYYEGGIRQEMIDAFGAVVKAINQTAMKARAAKLDGKRTKEYWTTGEEMSARAFESYLISKLQDQNASNDYLANVVSEKTWDAMAALGMENENSYPYPTAAEIPAIRAGFDHFFQTVETKEDDAGNVAMFSRRSASGNRLPDVVIGHKLGSLSSHPDYEAAKAGNSMAAARIASDLVDDAMVEAVRRAAGNAELIVPVVSVEATGRNKIPLAVARELADRLGSTAETEIVQADSPKRTSMDGLSRLLNPPVFDGPVTQGAAYVLVDDTVTQGGTFASLASHIRDNGGEVAGVVALTLNPAVTPWPADPVLVSVAR